MSTITKARPSRIREDASDLVAVVSSRVDALHKQASRLCGDVRRLYGKIDGVHRAADRLHRKVETTRARIRILRSQDRVRRRKQTWLHRSAGSNAAAESD